MLDTTFIKLDSLSIVPSSFKIFKNNIPVSDFLYEFNPIISSIVWKGKLPITLKVEYVLLSMNFSKVYYKKDTSIIQSAFDYKNPFRSQGNSNKELDLFGMDDLNKSGSLSRGISLGNAQDLGVNSNFNLQLSGKIGGDINLLASITDDNIPIQPDGNTQQLQDFDNVFIQLSENNWKLIAGDFTTENMDSHYLRFRKKSKGLLYSNTFELKDSSSLQVSSGVSISRGKYATQFFQGIEGNQGPYKLVGADNEQFILVLSGTEQVFIDGNLLKRGAENDYVIDYNTAEIIFTPSFLITKNKRIEVQFQYSDRNYLRSLAQANLTYKKENSVTSLNFYSEQDHKNQPLFQDLEDEEKALMASVGNNIENAFVQRENRVGEDNNVVSYEKLDSLGYSIYKYSNSIDSNLYRLQFANLGVGKGNYVLDGFSPFGKIYKWTKPDTVGGVIIRNGEFEPVVLLITPKRKQMLTLENVWDLTENTKIISDLAFTNQDYNTFSSLDSDKNYGVGGKFEIKNEREIDSTSSLITGGFVDFTSINFNPIEKFRAIEFNRNWNLGTQEITTPLFLANVKLGYEKDSLGTIDYNFDVLDLGEQFRGFKNNLALNLDTKKYLLNYSGSLLNSKSEVNTTFYRHKSNLEYRFSKFSLGYRDEAENNEFVSDTLLDNSYSFYDGRVYVKNNGEKNQFNLYYGYRDEKTANNNSLKKSAFSHETGLDYNLISFNKFTQLKGNVAYRKLVPTDTNNGLTPENTFLNQTNFSTSFWKRLVKLNTFYSIGSGLEQKREFLYVEVNPGQGVFAWIDYNENGVKELNEFEVAAFVDQANFIRVFTQSNEYIKTFSNQFSQSISINPYLFLKSKKGKLWKFVSKISSVSAYRIDRKTTQESFESSLNPFVNNLDDEGLVSLNKNIFSSLFFNRTGYKYGVELRYEDRSNKTLLSNGFDSRNNESIGVNLRYRLKQLLLNWESETGEKTLTSNYLSSRNFSLDYWKTSPTVTFQKGINFNWDFVYSYAEKRNKLAGDFASISTLGTTVKYTVVNKLNLSSSLNFVAIGYTGANNSSLEYEMLEGLKKGNNYTWELLLNRRVAKNLDLTLNYNGRKPESIKTIHSGTVQIRAFF
ncbi:hypothetical protein N9P38_01630 [Flavobacteriales bacterium]|nr:hypothetical protein [Flavobacteriales bacterium]MDB4088678.1 hypothetical protein [Flavobacteriales bacterium]